MVVARNCQFRQHSQVIVTDYTESGGKGDPVDTQEKAVAKMLELHEVCAGMMYAFDPSQWSR